MLGPHPEPDGLAFRENLFERPDRVAFDWLTFDEWYSAKPSFLRGLTARKQRFVAEVPRIFRGWIEAPKTTSRPYRKGRGRGRRTPRLVSGARKAQTVEQLAASHPALRDQPWDEWRVKDTKQGPVVWKVKQTHIFVKDEEGLPTACYHLLVCKNPLTRETKDFVSNAPPKTRVKKLLPVAFSRWSIERCFEDQKGEIGLTHWEGRSWKSLKRRLVLSSVSHLFLALTRERLRGEKPGDRHLPDPNCGERDRSIVVA